MVIIMLQKYEFEIEGEIVDQAKEIYDELGLDLNTAIRMFLVRSIRVDGIPFDLAPPWCWRSCPGRRAAGVVVPAGGCLQGVF